LRSLIIRERQAKALAHQALPQLASANAAVARGFGFDVFLTRRPDGYTGLAGSMACASKEALEMALGLIYGPGEAGLDLDCPAISTNWPDRNLASASLIDDRRSAVSSLTPCFNAPPCALAQAAAAAQRSSPARSAKRRCAA